MKSYVEKRKVHLVYYHPAFTETKCGRKLDSVWLLTDYQERITCNECKRRIEKENQNKN